VGLSSVLPILGMSLTYTRSSMIALILALILVLSLIRWRSLFWLILFVVLLFGFAPSPVRQHYLSIFRQENYRDNIFSSYLRFITWDFAKKIIKTYPELGIGYGERDYEFINLNYIGGKTGSIRDEGVLTRNTYLQIVCESGVMAGLCFILAFISLMGLLLGVFIKKELPVLYRRFGASLFGLMIGIATFMLTNYVLNYSSGMLVWIIFALSLCFIRIIYPEEWAIG
ncbi:MAG: O-antigen ligase family protein, partial [Candidatus Sumerlaeia bacterium]|nr:O-antigen ligase family protein [Candidatus Sumerlaeia bacterium]